jgi:hypothetical protein
MARLPLGVSTVKDLVLVVVGLLGIFYETVIVAESTPGLVAVFAGMLGYPVVVGKHDAPK